VLYVLNYLIKDRKGQFFLIGTLFMILGFVGMSFNQFMSVGAFYIAIFFLGFFAAKTAVIDTIQSKSPNVDLLMILAAIGAVSISYESEAALLLFIFSGSGALEGYASNKSKKSITELMSHAPVTAHLLSSNGDVVEVSTEALEVGQIVVVSKGEQVPIDGYTDRTSMLNESALTGESIPVEKKKDEEVFAGTINEGNAFYLTVNKTSDQTIFSNIIRMVEEAQNKPSKVSKFIDRIEKKYVISVLVAVPIFIFILFTFNQYSFEESFYRGMILLTVASPCALVASVTPATLSAISNGANKGVLFKGGAAMEALSSMEVLYTDKTGTLTYGKFQVADYACSDAMLKEVIYMEQQSSHPIAKAIVDFFKDIDLSHVDKTVPVEERPGYGVNKGNLIIGKPSLFDNYDDPYGFREKNATNHTTIFVSKENKIVGYFSLEDRVRKGAKEAIAAFKKSGINVTLLTGDNQRTAKKVSEEVSIENYHAACSPEDKIKHVKDSQNQNKVVGMIGDGINDAPALANANIGIAMGSGSSVAMESSDIVIVKNDLSRLYDSFELSKKLYRIIVQNVTFALSVIVVLIFLNIFGYLDLPMGVIYHEGSTILVILNGLRLLKQSDNKIEKLYREPVFKR
jgi:Zn2+/Cd2+-exporting ATPase